MASPPTIDILADLVSSLEAISTPDYHTASVTVRKGISDPGNADTGDMPLIEVAIAGGEISYQSNRQLRDVLSIWVVGYVNGEGDSVEDDLLNLDDDILHALHVDVRRDDNARMTRVISRDFDLPNPYEVTPSRGGVRSVWYRCEVDMDRPARGS